MRYEKHFYEGRNSGFQYYEIRNDLKPLVLLHAQAVDSTSFFCVMPKLARHFHVYAVDCYGHGRSLHDASRYNVADIGNAVIDFIWNVVMEPACLLAACQKSLAEFRVRRREINIIRFLPRHVRGGKHFARSERRIVRYQRTTEAQNAAKLSRKSGEATFSTVSSPSIWTGCSMQYIFIYASAACLPTKCSTRPTATPASAGHTQPRPSRASGR